jgi:hypothetical protein
MKLALLLTLTLQIVAPALKLSVGVAALFVARRLGPQEPRANVASWWVSGVAMTYLGVSNTLQGVGAAWAVAAGDGPVMDAFMRMVPVGNQSRTMLVIAMGLVLAAIAAWPDRVLPRVRTNALAAMGAFTLVGAAIGWAQGSMTEVGYLQKALFDVFELLSLFLALWAALWKDTMDRLLWQCLAAYGFYSALNVIWFSFLSWWGQAGVWVPNPIYIHVYATVIHTLMLGIAIQRLRHLRGHHHVPTLMESLGPGGPRVSLQ